MKHKTPSTSAVVGPAGKLRVTSEGEGGMPALFIHDNAADASHWAETQHSLQTHTVAFDLRGVGDSGGGHGPFGVDAAVEDVAAVADALLPERFVIVGHGFGAAVAGAFASYYPERLAGLLLVEPGPDLRKTPQAERDALLEHFSVSRYGAFSEQWLAPLLMGAKPATRNLVLATLHTSRREAVAGNLESLFHYNPADPFEGFTGLIHALVSSVGPKTLVGERPSLSHKLAPHASHWLMLDAPQWFHTELVQFLGIARHAEADRNAATQRA